MKTAKKQSGNQKEIDKAMENLVIIGSGCAGLTAAIYASRANLKPIVLEGEIEIGGQLTLTTNVENFPGFEQGVPGPELINKTKKQALKFGTRFISKFTDKITKSGNGNFIINYKEDGKNKKIETKAVIIASGASARWLGVKGEDKLKGRGISTCATCDGFFYKGKNIIVVGGGDSTCEESLFLSKLGINKIFIVHRKDSLRASKIMQDRVLKDPKIEFIWNSEIVEFLGEKKLEGVKIKNTKDNKIKEMKIDGVFLAIGHNPNTKFLGNLVEVDDQGFIKTDRFTHTNIEGIFACGDVQDPRFKQAVTAAGSGCMAAMEAEKYLNDRG